MPGSDDRDPIDWLRGVHDLLPGVPHEDRERDAEELILDAMRASATTSSGTLSTQSAGLTYQDILNSVAQLGLGDRGGQQALNQAIAQQAMLNEQTNQRIDQQAAGGPYNSFQNYSYTTRVAGFEPYSGLYTYPVTSTISAGFVQPGGSYPYRVPEPNTYGGVYNPAPPQQPGSQSGSQSGSQRGAKPETAPAPGKRSILLDKEI